MVITVDKLIECGLPRELAQDWDERLSKVLQLADPILRWQAISSELLTPAIPFAVHECLYETNYQSHRKTGVPCPAWIPDDDEQAAAHISQWMRNRDCSSYEELHAWSVRQPEEFLNRLTAALGIRFFCSARRGCDLSLGADQFGWFPQAKMNIVESCFQAADDKIAIVYGNAQNQLLQVSYGELKAYTARVANGLREMGLVPGDRVALSMPMRPEAIAIFLGTIAAGCSVVTIADSFSVNEMQVRLDITQPKCMFIQDMVVRNGKSHPLFLKIADHHLPAIVLTAGEKLAVDLRAGDRSWTDFLPSEGQLYCEPRCPADETTVLFSSGTTGHPKAIPWDHVTPMKCASDAFFHQDVHPQDMVCWPTNLGWMMGPWLIYASMINQASMGLSDAVPTGRLFCEFVQKAGVTILGLVPSLVCEWRKYNHTQDLDWSAIRLFSSTGECSNPSDMLWLMSRAGYRPVIEYCGGTELGGGYIAGTLTKPAVPGLFSAKAMGMSWLLLDESFQLNDVGEVFIEPPALGLSTRLLNRDHYQVYYAALPAGPQQQLLRRHGDQLETLAGGYYRARGRTDDAMNLGGIKVSGIQIEELLLQHAAVQEVAAISVPPPGGGPETLIICVSLKTSYDIPLLHAEMQRLLKEQLNPLFRIQAVHVIDRLPRTASNKVMRRSLRELVSEDSL